jgi:hypothetical protein
MYMAWIWPWVTLAAVVLVLYLVVRDINQSSRGEVVERFACPSTGAEVTATFVSDFLDPRRFAHVRRCSLFPGEQPPGCAKACLALGKDAIVAQDRERRPPLPVMPLA